MKHSLQYRLTLAVVAALASACGSGPPPAPEPLPFHVALVPLESIEMREASDNRKGAATEMLIETDPALFSELLVTSLKQDAGFARATLLEPDPALPEDASDDERSRMWMDQAHEVGADLILVCDMSLSPIVYQNPNNRFLANIPVWFLVGPFSWLLRDRTYHMDADLTASFYSPELLNSDTGVLTDRMARVAAVTAHFGELDKNFISRAQGRLGRYALTIIVPPGFVAKQSDALAASLTAATESALCQGVATLVQSRAGDIVRGDYLAPFYLVPADLALEPGIDGTFALSGIVQLVPDRDVPKMTGLRVSYANSEGQLLNSDSLVRDDEEDDAAEVRDIFFGSAEVTEGSRWTRYPFEASLTPPPAARLVRLEVVGSVIPPRSRTYTLVLPIVPIAPMDVLLADKSTGPPPSRTEQ